MDTTAYELLMKGAFIPAMPLVLNKDRHFDEAKQRRLIRYYLESGPRSGCLKKCCRSP